MGQRLAAHCPDVPGLFLFMNLIGVDLIRCASFGCKPPTDQTDWPEEMWLDATISEAGGRTGREGMNLPNWAVGHRWPDRPGLGWLIDRADTPK